MEKKKTDYLSPNEDTLLKTGFLVTLSMFFLRKN